jgi:HD superfamily phosphohydrolase
MPEKPDGEKIDHEDYSAAIIRSVLRDVIENHDMNVNCRFKADDIAALLEGSSKAASNILWRDIINGQMDADRMDYLLRDSYHIGVA